MVDEDAARRIAEAELARWAVIEPEDPEHEIVIWKVEEHPRAWVAHFASRQWLRTQDSRHTMVGSCPLVVEKDSGQLHVYGSGPDEYAQYLLWLEGP